MNSSDGQTAIKRVVEARCRAVADGDSAGIVADVAEDVTIFDVVGPMFAKGKSAAMKRAEEWLDSYDGSPSWGIKDLHVVAGDDVGFCHCISRVQGQLKTGEHIDMWFRTTLGFRNINGNWQIVHDHSSDPFDPETGMATMAMPEQYRRAESQE